MNKHAFFFIDDVIWVMRDLTRQKPKKLFDNPFLALLKEAHDKYGLKTQLNIFYQTDRFYGNDDFNLSEMTDAYKKEWEANSDWLKFGFHARQEFPDYPYINADYDHVYEDFKLIEKEVIRFAGDKIMAKATTPHWRPISKDACLALRDCGIKLLSATYGKKIEYDGDASSLPYGHSQRLLCNRKKETSIFVRDSKDAAISRSLCGYNHITEEERDLTRTNLKYITDPETGIGFKDLGSGGAACLNLINKAEVMEFYSELPDMEFFIYGTHEQYFYPDYFAYQEEYPEKILLAAKLLSEKGYKFIFSQDII